VVNFHKNVFGLSDYGRKMRYEEYYITKIDKVWLKEKSLHNEAPRKGFWNWGLGNNP